MFSLLAPDKGVPLNWQHLTFGRIPQHTRYEFIRDEGLTVLEALSGCFGFSLVLSRGFRAGRPAPARLAMEDHGADP